MTNIKTPLQVSVPKDVSSSKWIFNGEGKTYDLLFGVQNSGDIEIGLRCDKNSRDKKVNFIIPTGDVSGASNTADIIIKNDSKRIDLKGKLAENATGYNLLTGEIPQNDHEKLAAILSDKKIQVNTTLIQIPAKKNADNAVTRFVNSCLKKLKPTK